MPLRNPRILCVLLLMPLLLATPIRAEEVQFKPLDLRQPITHACLTEDGKVLIAAHETTGAVSVIDVAKGQVLKTVEMKSPRFALARGENVYVVNFGAGTISVLGTKDWELVNELALPEKSIYYISAPQGRNFKNELIASGGEYTKRKFFMVDARKDSSRPLREEIYASVMTLNYRGDSVIMQGEFSHSPMATVQSFDFGQVGNRQARAERGEHEDTPLLRQVNDTAFWFNESGVYGGMPPRIIRKSTNWIIPDQTRQIVYEVSQKSVNASQVGGGMAALGERPINAFPKIPPVGHRRRDNFTLAPLAATLDEQTYLFIPTGNQFMYASTPAFSGKDLVANSGGVGPQTGLFPQQVFIGDPVKVALLPQGTTGQFTVMDGPPATIGTDGLLTWTPAADQRGVQSFKIRSVVNGKTTFLRYTTEVLPASQRPAGGIATSTPFAPSNPAAAANNPSQAVTLGTHFLADPQARMENAGGARGTLILDGNEVRILDESGLNVKRKVELKRRYKDVRERNGTLIALSDNSLDLIDGSSGVLKKSIELKCAGTNGFDIHPKSEISYVSWIDSSPQRVDSLKHKIVKVDENSGRVTPLADCLGKMVAVHPGGRILITALNDLVGGSAVLTGMYGPVAIVDNYENLDFMMSYDLVGDGVRLRQITDSPGANGKALRLAPSGDFISYVSGGGYIKKRYYHLPNFPINDIRTPKCTYFTEAYPADLAYHPSLPLVAGSNGVNLKIFDRETGDELANNVETQGEKFKDIKRLVFSADGRRLLVLYQNDQRQPLIKAFGLKLTPEQQAKLGAYTPPTAVAVNAPFEPKSELAQSGATPAAKAMRREDFGALVAAPGAAAMKPKEVVASFQKAVAVVRTPSGNGTGFFIGQEGYLLTCAHVIGFDGRITISFPDGAGKMETFQGAQVSVIRADFVQDLALLKVTTGKPMKTVRFDPAKTDTGEEICILGNPGLGDVVLDYTLTNGLISNSNRILEDMKYFQTNAAVNPGSSGSPVFNSKGNVIGVVVMKADMENTAFVIPFERVKAFLDSVLQARK